MNTDKKQPMIHNALLNVVLSLVITLPSFHLATSQQRNAIVTQKEILRIGQMDTQKQEIVQLNSRQQIILKRSGEAISEFFVSGIEPSALRKPLFTCPSDRNPVVRFSHDGRWIEFATEENGKWVAGFYEIASEKKTILRDKMKDIVSGSRSTRDGMILYQAREKGAMPRVYLANPDGSNPRFIADGMGESWAPNGKWFLVMRPEIDRAAIQDKKSGLPEVKKWTCWIYTSKGLPALELSKLSRSSLPLWSPTSEKIVVMEYDGSGLTVVNIQVTSGKIRGYELRKVSDPSAEIRNPSWSQDGRLIAFVKSYLNKSGDNYAKNEIWISTTDGKRQQKIRESIGSNTELPLWPEQGRILLLTKSVEPDRVSSVLEFTLQNIDQLLK